MSARASIYYDTSNLDDVLYLQDVRVTEISTDGSSHSIAVRLGSSDTLLGDLLGSLTSLKRDQDIQAARRLVDQTARDLEKAKDTTKSLQLLWRDANEEQHTVQSAHYQATKALEALEYPGETS